MKPASLATLVPLLLLGAAPARALDDASVDAAVTRVMPQVVEWRRDFHQHPELGNREFRTAKIVAEQLRAMGLEVRTGLAHTGVVGVLKGGKPGRVVGLRADMDALPVTEQVDVPFKSTATAEYRGEKVGVMHACGHDGHTAILLGAAKILAGMREQLPGTVLFVFQPAEEGAPDGELGGAPLMLKEGLFAPLKPEAMFGLHLWSSLNVGELGYRSGPFMAAADRYRIDVKGRQTHGSRPWGGIDPIVTSSQIVMALQTVVARHVDITQYPAVVSVGAIKGGIRNNIIPDSVEMVGTIRTFDPQVREQIVTRMQSIVTNVAESAGATGTFTVQDDRNPVVVNDPELSRRAAATLARIAGEGQPRVIPYVTGAEDFSYYAQQVPSFFFFVGSTPRGQDAAKAPSNHSPLYFVDEGALPIGVRALTTLALDFLRGEATVP